MGLSKANDEFLNHQYSLSPDPSLWGSALAVGQEEEDDHLHNPHPRRDYTVDDGGHIFTTRGIANIGCIVVLCVGIIGLL